MILTGLKNVLDYEVSMLPLKSCINFSLTFSHAFLGKHCIDQAVAKLQN